MNSRVLTIALISLINTFSCAGQGEVGDDEVAREVITYTTAWINGGAHTMENYRNRGLAYHHLDSLNLALKDFTSALKIDPGNAELYALRASANYDNGRYIDSIVDYDSAISLNRANMSFFVGRGAARVKNGDVKGANEDYSFVIRVDSLNELALFNRAILFWKVPEQKQLALRDFARLLEHYPNEEYYYDRGEFNIELKNYDAALNDMDEALALNGKSLFYQVERAFCLGMLGRDSEATVAFNKLEKHASKNPIFYWRRGLWRAYQNKDSLACADFRKSARLGLQLDREQLDSLLSKCR